MDRNLKPPALQAIVVVSLSARRAWIEMLCLFLLFLSRKVALRKESVDRNIFWARMGGKNNGSLSARRAWIEIACAAQYPQRARPSLSARRAWIEIAARRPSALRNTRRSPQGERG